MLVKYSALAVVAATVASAAPLNINLGAYSPALVVGDGEISFAGNQGAGGIVSTLQGAAAGNAGAVANGQAIAPAQGQQDQATQVQDVQQASVLNEKASLPIPGVTKELDPRQDEEEDVEEDEGETVGRRQEAGLIKRQSGFDRALTYAEAALTKGPKVQLGTEAAGVGIIVDNNPQAAAQPNRAG